MKLSAGDERLLQVPPRYESFWPSADAYRDGRLKALLAARFDGGLGAVQAACENAWNALRMTMFQKATSAGDFLSSQLRVVSPILENKNVRVIQGIFASINWKDLRREQPAAILEMLGTAAVPPALTALTAVPFAGQLVAAYTAAGLKLAAIATRQDQVALPWAEYSRDTDEDLTGKVLIGDLAGKVDQTDIFAPPFDVNAPWRPGYAGDRKSPKGVVWAPFVGGDIPWSSAIGLMPGTMRLFGQSQLVTGAGRPPDDRLNRIARAPKGVTPKDQPLAWPPRVVNCGDFYPSAAQAAGLMWNACEKPGLPDMFKVHVPQLLDLWRRQFESLIGSFGDWWDSQQLLEQLGANVAAKLPGAANMANARYMLGAVMEPFVAVRAPLDHQHTRLGNWVLGSPWQVPSRWAMITPAVFRGGRPGDPAGRTPALWIEEDATRKPGVIGWPYGSLPRQHACSRDGACSSDLAAMINLDAVISPATWRGDRAPDGYRRMPWPPPEADASQYASPYEAFIRPALERLRRQQLAALQSTEVCAYVRPVAVADLPAYGAFRDPTLRQLCLAMREQLLKSPRRFCVDLADVDPIDPTFAARLRASGVTGTWRDRTHCLGYQAAPLVDGAPQPPAGEPPQGGVAFDGQLAAAARSGKGPAAAAAAALLGLVWFGGR